MLDVFDLQGYIAGNLAARAAPRMTRESVRTLKRLYRVMTAAAVSGRWDEVEPLNCEIHRLINQCADSPRLSHLLGTLMRFVPRRFYHEVPGWPDALMEDYAEVVAAMEARNADQARTTMAAHIAHAGQLLAVHLGERGLFERVTDAPDVVAGPRAHAAATALEATGAPPPTSS